MFFCDMHSDSLLTVNSQQGLLNEYNTPKRNPYLQFFAAFIPHRGIPAERRRRELMRMFDIYAYECERLGITKIDGVRSLIEATDCGKSCAMFSIEGGGGLLADSEELFTLHRAGLRVMSLVWDTNELGASAYEEFDTGLTDEGIRMVRRAAELGIVLDVSHLSDKSFYKLCEYYPLPIIATHSNFRAVCDNKRNLTLDMARIIAARGGVIGLNLYPEFLRSGGSAHINDIIPHIDYALEHLGENTLGFGFDIDGTDGKYPAGISTSASIHEQVADMLLSRYPAGTVEKIVGANVTDFLLGTIE